MPGWWKQPKDEVEDMTVDFPDLQQPLPILPLAVPEGIDIFDESPVLAIEVTEAPDPREAPAPSATIAPSAAQMPASTPPPTPSPARRSERTNRGVPPLRLGEMMMAAMEESAADDPITYKQAMKLSDAQEWKIACAAEVSSLIEYNVYTVVDRTTRKQVVTSKWVFKKKRGMSRAMEKNGKVGGQRLHTRGGCRLL